MNRSVKTIVKPILQLAAVAALIGVDHLLKNVAAVQLADGEAHTLIKGFLGFVYAENTGAAFSLFASSTNALSVFTGVLLAAGVIYLLYPSKNRPLAYDICVPLIIAGGAGNLIDRLTRGYVIDYIMTLFVEFPVFNFADCLITCGCFALVIYLIYSIVKDAKQGKTVPTKAFGANGETDD
ncbi:MAG: signal peptidase II [Clostridia bacterium]|nr:signal peptidase II [Clostridia bacterium]